MTERQCAASHTRLVAHAHYSVLSIRDRNVSNPDLDGGVEVSAASVEYTCWPRLQATATPKTRNTKTRTAAAAATPTSAKRRRSNRIASQDDEDEPGPSNRAAKAAKTSTRSTPAKPAQKAAKDTAQRQSKTPAKGKVVVAESGKR